MIITDLDQTVLKNDGTVSDYTRQVFKRCREAGIIVGIATARLYLNSLAKQDLLGADLLISSNGAKAAFRGALTECIGMGLETTNSLIHALSKLSSMQEILVETKDGIYFNTHRFLPPHPFADGTFTTFEQGIGEEAFQIFTGITAPEEAEAVTEAFPQCKCLHYRNSTRYAYIEKGVSKAETIRRAAEKLGIPMGQVAAFGDDEGDVEMLSACGMGIAVSNALPQVRQAADAVTGSNEEDGVAGFIEKVILPDHEKGDSLCGKR